MLCPDIELLKVINQHKTAELAALTDQPNSAVSAIIVNSAVYRVDTMIFNPVMFVNRKTGDTQEESVSFRYYIWLPHYKPLGENKAQLIQRLR